VRALAECGGAQGDGGLDLGEQGPGNSYVPLVGLPDRIEPGLATRPASAPTGHVRARLAACRRTASATFRQNRWALLQVAGLLADVDYDDSASRIVDHHDLAEREY